MQGEDKAHFERYAVIYYGCFAFQSEDCKNINKTTGIPPSDILRIVNTVFDEIRE